MTGAQRFILFGCLLKGVLCSQWSVWVPQSVEALNGSCVLIPCSFHIPPEWDKDLEETVKGTWIKGNIRGEIVLDSSVSEQKKGIVTGDLNKKNCTTILYKKWPKKLYFRFEMKSVQYTFPTLVKINTKDFPARPQITPDKVRVKEGDTVSLSCSAPAPCPILPPTLTWTPRLNDSVSVTELQEKEDKTKYVSSVLNFTASYLHHNKEMSCSAVYSLQVDSSEKTSQNSFILDVQYSPKNTSVSVSPAGSQLEGDSVTLNCSSKANPAVKNYMWYTVTHSGNKTVGSGQELIFNASRDGGQYFCGAQNEHGTEDSAIVALDVTYSPQISPPWSCNRTAAEISCSCESRGNPYPTIEWHLSDRLLTNSTDRVIVEEHLGTTGLRSSITMHQKQKDTHTLLCLSRNPLGSFGVSVYIPPYESDSVLIHMVPSLIGTAAGATVMMLVCILFQLFLCFRRRKTRQKHSTRMEDSAKELRVINQSPFKGAEQLYANKAMLPGDTQIVCDGNEEDEDGATTLHYANIDFSSVQSNGKEKGAGVIRGGSQKTTDYAEIRHKCQNNLGVKECKTELQDEEGEYAEVPGTRPGAEGEEKKGGPLLKMENHLCVTINSPEPMEEATPGNIYRS
ncbi:sialic acid-binding Ig-like lectin 10 [Scleropages formosus]|uniref:sialic acid-binding Ig-like lectin 10 n=1 Tax=Scleropages formosus TaxID=113540 RepID=UPI0010FA9526|nr:sialic acid-binding Ig-like lectin 10 [Scleropages formosus]